MSGVRHSASRRQNPAAGWKTASWNSRSASAPMSAPAAKASSEPAITMQRTSGSESKPRDRVGQLLHQRGGEGVARLRAVQPAERDPAVDGRLDQRGQR